LLSYYLCPSNQTWRTNSPSFSYTLCRLVWPSSFSCCTRIVGTCSTICCKVLAVERVELAY
jgi:hypothetical protein